MTRRPCDHAESSVLETRVRDGYRERRRYCEICTSTFHTVEVTREELQQLREARSSFEKTRAVLRAWLK